MTINLQPVPRYCVDCAYFKQRGTDQEYGRCYAPPAPAEALGKSGLQYVSAEMADAARPYASTMRHDPMKCGPGAAWFDPKRANV